MDSHISCSTQTIKENEKTKVQSKTELKVTTEGAYAVKRSGNRIEIYMTGCEWQERWARVESDEFSLIFTITVTIFFSVRKFKRCFRQLWRNEKKFESESENCLRTFRGGERESERDRD